MIYNVHCTAIYRYARAMLRMCSVCTQIKRMENKTKQKMEEKQNETKRKKIERSVFAQDWITHGHTQNTHNAICSI